VLRRVLVSIAGASLVLLTGCDHDSKTPSGTATINTVLPDDTVPAPGSCEPPTDAPAVPQIVIDGSKTGATLGASSDPCDQLTGEGFVTFNYNPVLLDAEGTVRVEVDAAGRAELTWPLGDAFQEVAPGRWESSTTTDGCARLLIDLVSTSGAQTATYGADIRVGGDDVACPQRDVEPTEPSESTG